MANPNGQTTQETERQNRLRQNRFAQSLNQTRSGFYEAPKKLRAAQREIFLATALDSSSKGRELPANQTGRKRAPTLSGFLARKFVGRQLARAEKERTAASDLFPQKSSSLITDEAERKSRLSQNLYQTKRGFPTLPISPAVPFKPKTGEEAENEPLDRPHENEENQENENQSEIDQEILQAQQLAENQQQERQNQQIQQGVQSLAVSGQNKNESNKARKKALTYVRRGVEELAQGIGNVLDLGTAGVSTLITIFMYAVNLTDFTMQTFSCYVKNSPLSFLFPPLEEWDPLPISTKILPIKILHAAVILADLFVLGMIVLAFSLFMVLAFGPTVGLGALIYQLSGGADTFLPIVNFFAQIF